MPSRVAHVAFVFTFGAACAVLISIAASQILLGLGILAFLLSRQPVRIPRAAIPLGLFLLGTLLSLALSPDPHAGLPQVRKLYVYLMLPLAFSVIRTSRAARNLLLAWCGIGAVGSLFGAIQFIRKWQEARALHVDFYDYYLASRITGFMSHWMTYSGEQMLVLVILIAFLFFGVWKGWRQMALVVAGITVIGLALLLSNTRSAWLAAFAAIVYLSWSRRKVLVALVPIAALVVFAIAPSSIRERADSIIHPRANIDSNDFRVICYRTGLRMIEAHPWFGLGPEVVHAQFLAWIPSDIPRPLPPGYYGHLHSIYVHYAAERGIPTLLALMAMFALMLWDFSRAAARAGNRRTDQRFLLHAAIACLIAILVEGFFELNLGDSEVLTLFLTTAAVGYVAFEDVAKTPKEFALAANRA